jgi:hypothetical protein
MVVMSATHSDSGLNGPETSQARSKASISESQVNHSPAVGLCYENVAFITSHR